MTSMHFTHIYDKKWAFHLFGNERVVAQEQLNGSKFEGNNGHGPGLIVDEEK